MYIDIPVLAYETWNIQIYSEDIDGNKKREWEMEQRLLDDLTKNTPVAPYNSERRHV